LEFVRRALEFGDAFTQRTPKLWQFAWTKHDQRDDENHDELWHT
jgi:hypothetical protein